MNNSIKDSELILNPDGSIYHLQLRPEEIADLIFTVGDPDRVEMLSKYFDRIEFKKAHREFVTHTGYIGTKRMSVISTGIGTDNIDIVLNELDALANIDFDTKTIKTDFQQLKIIRIGTSGSLHRSIPVDTFVASAAGLGLDSLMHYYQIDKKNKPDIGVELPILPYFFEADQNLLNKFSGMHSGITATCPGFYAPQGRSLRLKAKDAQILDKLRSVKINEMAVTNFEMETAGIYGLAHLMGHKALSLNAILANREAGTFSKNPQAT
ncbi:MAG: nucleoside phosphorylase, partial [Chitinophagales bacterium]